MTKSPKTQSEVVPKGLSNYEWKRTRYIACSYLVNDFHWILELSCEPQASYLSMNSTFINKHNPTGFMSKCLFLQIP
jgi:hypothetical protein